MMLDLNFYRGRRVFVTGHTGFKGSWLCRTLVRAGASVTGFSLAPPTEPSLFALASIAEGMTSVTGDVRDRSALWTCFREAAPEIVLHLAAQPIVREGYRDPHTTYETNVMGTVNLLECIRVSDTVRSFLNVTTDKVYRNIEQTRGYCESDPLDGFDPYSNSKSCSELVTHCYQRAFFADGRVAVSTARAGNVIGGGDFAADRILPDCIRAALAHRAIAVRHPHSTRPYQHVLETVMAYLMIAAAQIADKSLAGYYNVGPDEEDCFQTADLVELFCRTWGEDVTWIDRDDGGPHEASFLHLDCERLRTRFGWSPTWSLPVAVEKTVEWSKVMRDGGDVRLCMDRQIASFIAESPWIG